MNLRVGGYWIELLREDDSTSRRSDFDHDYDAQYSANGPLWQSAVGVRCGPHSVVLLAPGLRGGLDAKRVAHDDETLFVACGVSVFSLSVPELSLNWSATVDVDSCIGLRYAPEENCLVVCAGFQMSRLTLDGCTVWSVSCGGFWSGGFEVHGSHAFARGSDGGVHAVDLATGARTPAN